LFYKYTYPPFAFLSKKITCRISGYGHNWSFITSTPIVNPNTTKPHFSNQINFLLIQLFQTSWWKEVAAIVTARVVTTGPWSARPNTNWNVNLDTLIKNAQKCRSKLQSKSKKPNAKNVSSITKRFWNPKVKGDTLWYTFNK